VKPDGTGTACTRLQPCALGTAMSQATDGDFIYLAQGTYTGTGAAVVTVVRNVALYGGWDGAAGGPLVRDPDVYPTVLDGENARRVVHVSAGLSPTLDGFTITGGNADASSVGAGLGGGVYGEDASPTIQNNIIISNVASVSPNSGSGGGIYLYGASASALISGNQVLSNAAHSTSWNQGGGGLCLSYSDVTVTANRIEGNTCSYAGGGIYSAYGSPRIVDNEIRANVAGTNGGGIYSSEDNVPLIQGNLIISNVAGTNWHSGGILVRSYDGAPTITANRIFSNTAFDAAGLGLQVLGDFTVTNNIVAHNSNGGVRLWDLSRQGLIAHNTVAFNAGTDGGIRLESEYITPTVVNNILVSNTYGIRAHVNASGVLDYNNVWGNTILDYDLPGALEPGPHDIPADPLFVGPHEGDYHLRAGSPCINAGTAAGVTTDMDGDLRPVGAGYDVGADEGRWGVYLPVAVRSP
jgi:hypothetical protein